MNLEANYQDKIVPKNSRMSQNLLVIEGKINSQTLDILIDSGSNRTVISDLLAEKLGIKVMPVSDACGATGIGGRVQFTGRAEIELSIAGVKRLITTLVAKHDEIFNRTVFMVLVGYGAMKKFPPFLVDAKNDQLIMNGMRVQIGDPRANSVQMFKLHAENAVTLKAGMSTKVTVVAAGEMTPDADGLLVEEVLPALADKHIEVVQSVITADNKKSAFVFLNNPSPKDVQLYAGTTIAEAKVIRNGDEVQNGRICIVNEVQTIQEDAFIGFIQGFH